LPHAGDRQQQLVQEMARLACCVSPTKFCEPSNKTSLQRNALLIFYYFVPGRFDINHGSTRLIGGRLYATHLPPIPHSQPLEQLANVKCSNWFRSAGRYISVGHPTLRARLEGTRSGIGELWGAVLFRAALGRFVFRRSLHAFRGLAGMSIFRSTFIAAGGTITGDAAADSEVRCPKGASGSCPDGKGSR
jgi:hypothetical protein